jgi:hypothetical protein
MNAREEAQHLSSKLVEVQATINRLENELYTTKGNREQLARLKRIRKALSHDLDALVATIGKPVQFSLWDAVAPPASAPSGLKDRTNPLNGKVKGDALTQGAETVKPHAKGG